jgi:DNA-binding MarR family transcriptional regulator
MGRAGEGTGYPTRVQLGHPVQKGCVLISHVPYRRDADREGSLSRLTKCICTHNLVSMSPVSALSSCNCFAVRQAARYVTKLYERHLADAQLTSAQFSILGALEEGGPMTMADLASVLVMDRTTLLRAMKPLQREDLLKSNSSPADPRQLVFALSSAGDRKLKQALPLWIKAQEEFEAEVGPREAAQLRRSLLALAKST